MSLQETKQKLESILTGYDGFWAVAGGWAIDFFLHEKTREHKDIEIAVWRDEQASLQRFLADWRCEYYERGTSVPWQPGEVLQLPAHEIHCYRGSDEIELLLNERNDGEWIFRREPRITYPVEAFSLLSASGIRVLAPEIVLLYKSHKATATDTQDLHKALAEMSAAQRTWLAGGIVRINQHHPWLEYLNF